MEVVSQAVVFDQSPVFELVCGDDRKITLVQQLRPMDWPSASLVASAFFQKDDAWDAKTNVAVDVSHLAPCFGTTLFPIFLQDSNFISQEPRSILPCVSHQCLFLGEVKFQFLA